MKRLFVALAALPALFSTPAFADCYNMSSGAPNPACAQVDSYLHGGAAQTTDDSSHGLPIQGVSGGTAVNVTETGGNAAAFKPNGNYATITATNSSGNVALPSGATVEVYNTDLKNNAYVNFGTSNAVTATTSQLVVSAGGSQSFSIGANTYMAAITSAGSAALVIAGGSGNTGTTSGTASNTAYVSGIATSVGAGVVGTGSQRVAVGQDSTTVAGSASIPAGTNVMGKVGIDQTTNGTTNGVVIHDAAGNARGVNVDAQNGATVAGEGTAGSPAGGVHSVQGVAGGTPANVNPGSVADAVLLATAAGSSAGVMTNTPVATAGYAVVDVYVPTLGATSITPQVSFNGGSTYITDLCRYLNVVANVPTNSFGAAQAGDVWECPAGDHFQLTLVGSGSSTADIVGKYASAGLSNTSEVTSNVNSAASDSGGPVKVGGVYTTGPSAVSNGQRVNNWNDQFGNPGFSPQCGGCVPETITNTGTTGATTATLAAASGKTTYICGFSIRANATAAATGEATVTGVITATMDFLQFTAPLASGIGIVEENFNPPCIPASGTNQTISVVSAAPGSGGTVSVSAWGYQQ